MDLLKWMGPRLSSFHTYGLKSSLRYMRLKLTGFLIVLIAFLILGIVTMLTHVAGSRLSKVGTPEKMGG